MIKPWGIIVGIALLVGSCKPGTPSEFIQPDDMEDILVDYHLARAVADKGEGTYEESNYRQALYIESVLQKHGYTKAQFDSSLIYYYTRADRFVDIYTRVAERLEEQALLLGATEGEIGKYASLNATGDTANIWAEKTVLAMMPLPPYNRWEFTIDVDTTYKPGDSFLMQFMSDYMYQDGVREGYLYLAVTYDNDTTISRNLRFMTVGLNQLRIPEIPELRDHQINDMRGFFYLGEGNQRTTTTRLLFLNNIQLIRFHKKHEEEQTDSSTQSALGKRENFEILRR